MSYPYALAEDAIEGIINGITIKWQNSALQKLEDAVVRTKQPRALLKALTEELVVRAAARMRNTNAKIT
jgi:hypothetical protein